MHIVQKLCLILIDPVTQMGHYTAMDITGTMFQLVFILEKNLVFQHGLNSILLTNMIDLFNLDYLIKLLL